MDLALPTGPAMRLQSVDTDTTKARDQMGRHKHKWLQGTSWRQCLKDVLQACKVQKLLSSHQQALGAC